MIKSSTNVPTVRLDDLFDLDPAVFAKAPWQNRLTPAACEINAGRYRSGLLTPRLERLGSRVGHAYEGGRE
jgi:hypothetical protein